MTSKPMWSNTFGCSATSAFFIGGGMANARMANEDSAIYGAGTRCAIRSRKSEVQSCSEKKGLPKISSFDQPVEQPPADAAVDSRSRTPNAAPPCSDREEFAAMLVELQANRSTLKRLTSWYGLFVFTGGDVPTAQWNLAAMALHLERPSATDCLLTSEIQRYRDLIQTLGGLGQQGGVGPRTLRCRHDMGDKFRRVAAEIRVLTDTLESSLTKALKELASQSE